MKYRITYENEFEEPYFYEKDGDADRHLSIERWTVGSKQKACEIVKDFLDAPAAEMTLSQIDEDFGRISEREAVAIRNYYNGRLALWETARKDLDSGAALPLEYEIPEKYSAFGDRRGGSRQIRSFLKIEEAV